MYLVNKYYYVVTEKACYLKIYHRALNLIRLTRLGPRLNIFFLGTQGVIILLLQD